MTVLSNHLILVWKVRIPKKHSHLHTHHCYWFKSWVAIITKILWMCMCEVEHGVFTPLVFSTSGGMACKATVFYKQLAELASQKQEESYSVIMRWMRCRLSFALLRSAILCIRGSHSSFWRPVHEDDALLAVAEVELQLVDS